jgi:hypothetical protein
VIVSPIDVLLADVTPATITFVDHSTVDRNAGRGTAKQGLSLSDTGICLVGISLSGSGSV